MRGREIAADTHNSERLRRLFIVAKDQTLADLLAGYSIRKEFLGERLRNDGDEFRARLIVCRETAATQNRDAHRVQIVVIHMRDLNVDELRRHVHFRLQRGTRAVAAEIQGQAVRESCGGNTVSSCEIIADTADSGIRFRDLGVVDLQWHGVQQVRCESEVGSCGGADAIERDAAHYDQGNRDRNLQWWRC